MPARKSPTMIATEALEESRKANDAILKHTVDCTKAWKDCNETLKDLKARWEKLAWLIVASVVTGAAAIVIKGIFQ